MKRTRETGFLDRTVRVGGEEHRYQVWLPPDPPAVPPVILFLHGAGERGGDGILQTDVGIGTALRRHRERWPAIVVLPQARSDERWRGAMLDLARAALAAALEEFDGDEARVALTGISMGGYGVWRLALEEPTRFSALAPVCGGLAVPDGAPPVQAAARRLRHLPAWIFHGEADAAIDVAESRRMAEALADAGAAVRYTEYPDVGHDAWTRAYAEPELPRWLLAQRRSSS